MFQYDKVYGGTFWYANVYKEYGVIWCISVKTGFGNIFKDWNQFFLGLIT